jgi:hypothetical protein
LKYHYWPLAASFIFRFVDGLAHGSKTKEERSVHSLHYSLWGVSNLIVLDVMPLPSFTPKCFKSKRWLSRWTTWSANGATPMANSSREYVSTLFPLIFWPSIECREEHIIIQYILFKIC